MKAATLGQRFSFTVIVSAVIAFTTLARTELQAQPACGNGIIDSGEQCDPPDSITCPPGSPAGAFLPCNADCTCGSPDGALLDHFKCYAAKQGKPPFVARDVDLVDQFGASTPSVRKPIRFCNPTRKNDEEINDSTGHLACYKMKGGANPKREVLVRNQFGDLTVTVNKAESLCVPAEKNGVPSELALNHFQCYRVRGKSFTSRDVTLSDQFGTAGVTVVKPRRLCVPVDKNGEGIVDEAGHLMCYRIKQPGDSPKRDVTVDDQFGSFTPSVRRPVFLCVPSLKNPAATTTTTSTSSTSSTSIEASTTTSSTSTTSTTAPLCGNSMPDPGEQCDPPGSLTCPPTSPGGAFTECADDCSCPGVPTTTSTSSTTSTTEVVPTTTSSTSTTSTTEPTTTTSTTLEPTTTTAIVTTTTSTSSTSTTLALCCGPERITLTSSVGTLVVDNLAPFAFPSGVTTTLDTSAASGGAACVHDVIVPGGGFSVPNFDIPALNYCSSVTPNGCESGTGQGAGTLWDGNGTPGVALTDVTASADTADGVCDTTAITQGTCTGGTNNGNPCVQPPDCPGGTCTGAAGCTTAASGAGGNTLGDIDRTVAASPGGGVRSLIDIPVHSLTWSDSVCSPAITPGCCPTSAYNPGDGDLVITEFDFVLRPSTGTATGLFADKNGNLCKRAGSGFSNPTPDGPQSLTGAAATGPCCVPGQATTVVSVGIGFSGGAPLFDLGFKSTIPNTVASCGSPGAETCTVTTDTCLQ